MPYFFQSLACREVELSIHPFQRRVSQFRNDNGYGSPLWGNAGAPGALPPPPTSQRRLEEILSLLEAPACPRPRGAFEAFCLAFQLIVAVDSKYFGPLDPASDYSARLGLPSVGGMVGMLGRRGWTGMPFGAWMLALGPHGEIELWQADGANVRLFPRSSPAAASGKLLPALAGPLQELQRYIESVLARGFAPRPGTSKQQRMGRFLELLGRAPRPANDLVAIATVNSLLAALETAVGCATSERLNMVLPFTVWAAPAFPHAALLLSVAHALFYYRDGSVAIYERARELDRVSATTMTMRLGRCRASLSGGEACRGIAVASL